MFNEVLFCKGVLLEGVLLCVPQSESRMHPCSANSLNQSGDISRFYLFPAVNVRCEGRFWRLVTPKSYSHF